jgi:hypothetical protein
MGGAQFAQHCDIAAALLAKGEILARHHARRADPVGQQAGDELLRRRLRQGGVEFKHQHGIGPRRGEQFLPLVQRREAERRRLGSKWLTGWGSNVAIITRRPSARAQRTAGHHGLVAQVEPVEIAQRHDGAAPVRARARVHRAGSWLAASSRWGLRSSVTKV